MKRIRNIIVRIIFAICKILLPKKYFDDIFIPEFLHYKTLKNMTLKEYVWCFAHGFLPKEYVWYDLANNDYRNYLPARNNFHKREFNGIYNDILANKILFETHIKTIINGIDKLHVIESIGFIEKGFLRSLHKDIIPCKFSSVIQFLERTDLILKPISGDGGVGVFLVKKEKNYFILNGKKTDLNELIGFFENLDDYLIQEKFVQHGFSSEIYPGSVNTMRVGTMIDHDTQHPFIAYAAHRFGTRQSCNVDNVNQGGIAAIIDLSDGKLSKGRSFSNEGVKQIFELHPDSSKPINNETIPGWSSLTCRILEMAKRMPYLKYVGWDIILSNDELFILEGNVSPQLGLIQIFKPMKDFPSAWNFFKKYKYIE